MKTIYKYTIKLTERQNVTMPVTADIICAQVQDGKICLWATVDTESEFEERLIGIFGTGNALPQLSMRHIDTVQIAPFVWHIFEIY